MQLNKTEESQTNDKMQPAAPLEVDASPSVILLTIAPAGFWPRGQNPRRHPRSPRVYTYKDKEYLLKK